MTYPVADAAGVLSAIADLIWPLLVVTAVLLLYVRRAAIGPTLRELVRTREVSAELPGGFKFNIGGQEVPAQQVVDGQRHQTEELRTELLTLRAQVAELLGQQAPETAAPQLAGSPDVGLADMPATPGPPAAPPPAAAPSPAGRAVRALAPLARRLLWVDDEPVNNAYEIASLGDRAVVVDIVTSTEQALERLADDPNYDAIVTDLRRKENGDDQPTAGLTLLRKLQEQGRDIPVVVYAGAEAIALYGPRALELGAAGATANSTELLELLAANFGPRFASRFEREVRRALEAAGWQLVAQPQNSRIDVIAERGDDRIGVEAKAWVRPPTRDRLSKELERVARAGPDTPIWIVSPSPVQVYEDIEVPGHISLLSFDEFRASLQ